MYSVVILSILFCLVPAAHGIETDDTQLKLDALLETHRRADGPGVAAAIIKNGRLTHQWYGGMANLEHGIAIGENTVFRIASTSKQFTAACIALLEHEGSISLDDSVRVYFPELPQVYEAVTIGNLVHHTSGILDYADIMVLKGVSALDQFSFEEAFNLLRRQRQLIFPPGEQWSYSNSNYLLLGALVHRITGTSLRTFARERLFKPAGMDASLFLDDTSEPVRNRADGYRPGKNGWHIFNTQLDVVGDGGLFTTVSDLSRWDSLFYSDSLFPGFSQAMRRTGTLADGTDTGYAFGLSLDTYRGFRREAHAGGWAGFRANMMRLPDERLTVVVLSNDATCTASQLCEQILEIVLDLDPVDDHSTKPGSNTDQPAAGASAYTGTYESSVSDQVTVIEATEDGTLLLVLPGRNIPLRSIARDSFKAVGISSDLILTFKEKADGVFTLVEILLDGEAKQPRTRRLPVQIEGVDLQQYVGTYYSEALDEYWQIMRTEEGLRPDVDHIPPGALVPLGEHTFSFPGAVTFSFTADASGHVIGFNLDTGRNYTLQFNRIQQAR